MFGPKMNIKILLIDDELVILNMLTRMLERKGYETVAFQDPEEALNCLKSDSINLIICDLKMPEMDGIEVIFRAKRARPKVPIILITGFASIPTAVNAIQLGAYDYVRKPFDMAKICSVVEKALASTAN